MAKMRTYLPRVALIGGAVLGVGAAAFVAVRRLFRSGYDERPLGEPIVYPAAGAGTGFPEPTSPEHTEAVAAGIVPELHAPLTPQEDEPAGSIAGEPFFQSASAAPEDTPSPHVSAGSESAGTAAFTPARPQDATDATLRMPPLHATPPAPAADLSERTGVSLTETPQALSPDSPAGADGAFTAVPSEPLQRAPVPLTEEQAENSARIQVHQNQLYAAFPGLTPGDIVASDGDLDRLAASAAERAQIALADARARLDAILNTGPDQHADSGIEPDLVEPRE